MAKRTPERDPDSDINDDDLDDDLQDLLESRPAPDPIEENEDFRRALASLGGDDAASAIVYVHREVKGRAQGNYLFNVPVSEFHKEQILERLKTDFGTGEYRFSLRVRGVLKTHAVESVEAPKVTAPPATGAGDVKDLIAAMHETTRQNQLQMMQMMVNSAKENTAMMVKMMEINANRGDGGSMGDVLKMVMALREMQPAKGDGTETLLKGIELGQKFAGNGGDESMAQTLVKAAAPVVGDLAKLAAMAQARQPRPPTRPPVPQKPALAAVPVKPAPSSGEPSPAQPAQPAPTGDALEAALLIICKAAEREADPELYAEMLVDNIGDDMARQLFESDDHYQMILGQIDPGLVESRRDWFDELRECVLGFTDNLDEPDQDAPEPGNPEPVSDAPAV